MCETRDGTQETAVAKTHANDGKPASLLGDASPSRTAHGARPNALDGSKWEQPCPVFQKTRTQCIVSGPQIAQTGLQQRCLLLSLKLARFEEVCKARNEGPVRQRGVLGLERCIGGREMASQTLQARSALNAATRRRRRLSRNTRRSHRHHARAASGGRPPGSYKAWRAGGTHPASKRPLAALTCSDCSLARGRQ